MILAVTMLLISTQFVSNYFASLHCKAKRASDQIQEWLRWRSRPDRPKTAVPNWTKPLAYGTMRFCNLFNQRIAIAHRRGMNYHAPTMSNGDLCH